MVTLRNDTAKFWLFRPGAGEVRVVGDFTHWRGDQIPMKSAGEGYWEAEVALPPGVYHFRYLVDGQGCVDHSGGEVVQGPFGAENVLWVGESGRREEAARSALTRPMDARMGLPAPRPVGAALRQPACQLS